VGQAVAIRRKVASSIPDGVIGIFLRHNTTILCGPGVNSASNRNEYQEYFLGSKPPSCADCLEIWERQPAGTLRAVQVSNGNVLSISFTFF
jgi:hypothetical protein